MRKLFSFALMITAVMLFLLAAPAVYADVDEDIEDIEERLDVMELKLAKHKIYFGGDFRVRWDSVSWHIPRYQQVVDPTTQPPGVQQMEAQNWDNSATYTSRLRLKMGADISSNLHFYGRLNMYRAYGGAEIPIFNGQPDSLHNSFNSTRIPTDNTLRVERAYFTYKWKNSPIFMTLGRQATTDGPPRHIKEEMVRQGTPSSLIIDAEIEGFMLGSKLDFMGLPENSTFRLCYGVGYESGFGGGGNVPQSYVVTPFGNGVVASLDDSTVLGACFETPLPFMGDEGMFYLNYMLLQDLTDIPYSSLSNFPNPFDNNPQSVTATNNLGDMDLFGLGVTGDAGKLDYFAMAAWNKSDPNGQQSQYGFGGLLGNPDESENGFAYYLGAKYSFIPKKLSAGVEYNKGSENWFSYTPAADDPSNKLATRGDVWDLYLNWQFDKRIWLKVGYQHFNYNTAFSGWHIAPGPLEYFDLSQNPTLFYAFPDEVDNIYATLEVRF